MVFVVGDVAGIQNYLRGAAARGSDGAARRLRFRSFVVQALTEIAAHRLCAAVGVKPEEARLISSAGHFLLCLPAAVAPHLPELRRQLDEECRARTDGLLRVVLQAAPWPEDQSAEAVVDALLRRLQAEKRRPLAALLAPEARWEPTAFRPPAEAIGGYACPRCRVPRAASVGSPCADCAQEHRLGARLAELSRWCILPEAEGPFSCLGRGVQLLAEGNPLPPGAVEGTPLPQHVPEADFDGLAERACGRPLLAYVKVDGDGLGDLFRKRSLPKRQQLSVRVDGFFRKWLYQQTEARDDFYLVFGGGDDAFFVTPWDRALPLAERMAAAWQGEFQEEKATLSCGIALHSPRFPLAYALDNVAAALEHAKQREGKNCLSLLGERLSWQQVRQLIEVMGALVGLLLLGEPLPWEQARALLAERLPERDLRSAGGVPVSVVRALGRHLDAAAWEETYGRHGVRLEVLERYLRERALLLYTLERNAPPAQYPHFWRWARQWLRFDTLPSQQRQELTARLQVLRVAVPLALWASRAPGNRDD